VNMTVLELYGVMEYNGTCTRTLNFHSRKLQTYMDAALILNENSVVGPSSANLVVLLLVL